MLVQESGLSLRRFDGDGRDGWIAHSCKGIPVKKPLVSGIFVSLLLLLVGAGNISSHPGFEAEMVQLQPEDTSRRDAHLAYYEEHRVKLGIDRLNCR